MKTWILVLIIAVGSVWSASSTIDPANYIWIDYQSKNLLRQKNPNQYVVSLPCESRIGKCSYNYKLLPLNWQGASDGSLTIPKQDATKTGMFAIEALLSEPTGQKINANLVIKIQNGQLSVSDKADFFNQNGYNQKQSLINMNTGSFYKDSPLTNQQPENFPDLSTVESTISSGNLVSLSRTINEINAKYAPCRSKIKYLNSLQKLINQYAYLNKDKVKGYNADLKTLENTLKNLQYQKQNIFRVTGVEKQIEATKQKIAQANAELIRLQNQQIKYRTLSKNTLQQLKNVDTSRTFSTAQDKGILNGLQNLTRIQKWFENAFENKKILKKAILDIKLKLALKNIPNSAKNKKQLDDLQIKYSLSVNNFINDESKQIQMNIKLEQLKQKNNQQKVLLKMVNKKLSELQSVNLTPTPTPISMNSQKTNKRSEENRRIANKIQELQKKLIKLNECRN